MMRSGRRSRRRESRSRADRAGHHESRSQRARRHAHRRQAHDRDGERQPRRALRCATMRRVTPGHYVMLAVSDTGIGMDAGTLSRTSSSPSSRPRARQGHRARPVDRVRHRQAERRLHLGLQRAGKGTTFKIYLPRVTATGEAACARAPMAAGRIDGREMVLLVEDETTLRGLVRQYLQNQGYTVLEAHSGAAALRIASYYSGPIHLLLTDVIMPGMNGHELAQRFPLRGPTRKFSTCRAIPKT